MNFSTLSKEEKVKIYDGAVKSLYAQIFSNLLRVGIDPEIFSVDTFTYVQERTLADGVEPAEREVHDLMLGTVSLVEKLKFIILKINELK